MEEIKPITQETIVVFTYRLTPWYNVVAHLLSRKESGRVELNVSQGTVCDVKWRKNEK